MDTYLTFYVIPIVSFFSFFCQAKEIQTFKVYMLNWILQILHTVAVSNTKILKTHRLLNKMLLDYLSLLFSLFSATCCFLSLSQRQSFFQFWGLEITPQIQAEL